MCRTPYILLHKTLIIHMIMDITITCRVMYVTHRTPIDRHYMASIGSDYICDSIISIHGLSVNVPIII